MRQYNSWDKDQRGIYVDVKPLVFTVTISLILPPYSSSPSKLNEVTESYVTLLSISTLQHQSELVSFQLNYVLSSLMTTDPPLNLRGT